MSFIKIIYKNNRLSLLQNQGISSRFPLIRFELLASRPLAADINDALYSGVADVAVYPLADLPYPLPESLEVLALTADNEVLVSLANRSNLREVFAVADVRKHYGKVYITGFGPGNPDLLTVKADRVIRQADIIFYDSLISQEWLEQIDAEKIFVGKRKSNHAFSQDEINEKLYRAAVAGKKVVRLKGGDPLVFGRGGEEFDYLHSRLVQTEIIPGVTSATAAAAYTGIPLTHRETSSSVAFCTGFPFTEIQTPDTETVVYYMPSSSLHVIAQKLLASGRNPLTPVVLVHNASLPDQQNFFTNLSELLVSDKKYPAPLLMIAGATVENKNFYPQGKTSVKTKTHESYQA